MKTTVVRLAAPILSIALMLVLGSCYTQIGTVGEEQSGENAASYERDVYGGTVEYVDGDWAYEPALGFSYYYPPVWPSEIFATEYNTMLWDGYGPAYGTGYGSSWQMTPSHGAFGYPYYYSPYHHGYMPAYEYARAYEYTGGAAVKADKQTPATGGSRDFGIQRFDAPSAGATLPTAGSLQAPQGGGAPRKEVAPAAAGPRTPGSSRTSPVSPSGQPSNSGNRGTRSARPDQSRDTTPMPARPVETPVTAPAQPAPAAPAPAVPVPSGEPARGGSSRGSTPTTAPAPAPPPPAPAADTSASRKGRGGSRGG